MPDAPPWIEPPRPPPWRNPRKGRDQILPSGNLAFSSQSGAHLGRHLLTPSRCDCDKKPREFASVIHLRKLGHHKSGRDPFSRGFSRSSVYSLCLCSVSRSESSIRGPFFAATILHCVFTASGIGTDRATRGH